MTAEDRRTSDREFERVWRAIESHGEQIGELTTAVRTHAAVCTEAEKTRAADRTAMKAGLERLLKDADRRGWTVKLARAAWGALAALLAGMLALWDHVGPPLLRALGKG